ncbi:MAG: glycosyltransferase family 4 protein [Oscillospiraceae bacterium]|nr:glycosyltransferase family 4 protein [Oscillospiraceae bacterium]
MNILIINHYAGAPHLGRELRPYFFAKNWQAAGHHVTIATADHTHLRDTAPVTGKSPELRRIGEVSYLFFSTPCYNDSIAGRGRNIAAFVKGVWQNAENLAQEVRPDIVIAQSGYPYDFFPAQRIASMAGAKTVLEIRDLWPLYLQEHYRYSAHHAAVHFAEYMLGKAVGSADHVVRVLPHSDEYLRDFGLNKDKTSLILSGVAAKNRKHNPSAIRQERLKSFRGSDILVMYCGNVGINHDLENFVQSAALLKDRAKFVIVGNGGHKITLKRSAQQQELRNIMFLDAIPPSQIPSILENADILYFPLRRGEQNRYGVASAKLLNYMLSGKPVICDGDFPQNPVEISESGVVLKKSDPQEIAGAVGLLAEMGEQERQRIGEKGKEYVLKHRDYSLLSQQYLDLLEQLTKNV